MGTNPIKSGKKKKNSPNIYFLSLNLIWFETIIIIGCLLYDKKNPPIKKIKHVLYRIGLITNYIKSVHNSIHTI